MARTRSTGVFTWRPGSAQGGTSNRIFVVVADNGTPSMSATQSFSVVVRDTQNDLTVGFGTTNVLAGQIGSIRLDLTSGVDLQELDFELLAVDPHLSAFALQPLHPEVTALSIEPTAPGRYRVQLELNPNLAPVGSHALASLDFATILTGHSSIAELGVGDVHAYRVSGETVTRTGTRNGRIFIVETEPLMDVTPTSPPSHLRLTVYGKPALSYRVESRPSAANTGIWTTEATIPLGDASWQTLDRGTTNGALRIFRAVQP